MICSVCKASRGPPTVPLLLRTNPHYGIAANYLNGMGLGSSARTRASPRRVLDFGNRVTEELPGTQGRFVVGVRGEGHGPVVQRGAVTSQNRLDGRVTSGCFSPAGHAQATQATATGTLGR